jgi:hypothetical protein
METWAPGWPATRPGIIEGLGTREHGGRVVFIKTSTGKVAPAATLLVTLVMLETVRDFFAFSDRRAGVKSAGGIRTAKDAIRYLVLVNETAAGAWLYPRVSGLAPPAAE